MEYAVALIPATLLLIGVWYLVLSQWLKKRAEWAENNNKPLLSERARVVAKRLNTRGGVDYGGNVSTKYYTTFELPSGQRYELPVNGKEYGMLAEGDEGMLTYQGAWYRGFQRDSG